MSAVERTPAFVGGVTLVAGAFLTAAPERVTRSLGLAGDEAAVRAIGVSDLVLVPGLLRGDPRWPWMIARAALNLAVGAYLQAAAPRSGSPKLLSRAARALVGLSALDGAVGLALRR